MDKGRMRTRVQVPIMPQYQYGYALSEARASEPCHSCNCRKRAEWMHTCRMQMKAIQRWIMTNVDLDQLVSQRRKLFRLLASSQLYAHGQ
jgi:hypothetical protein